jgi:hypothetical protein
MGGVAGMFYMQAEAQHYTGRETRVRAEPIIGPYTKQQSKGECHVRGALEISKPA